MANSTTPLTPDIQEALDQLVPEWEHAQIPADQQRQIFHQLETLLSQASLQMVEEGQLTPDGPDYTPQMHQTVLRLYLTGLNAMVLKAYEERIPANTLAPLLSHGAYRCMEQARHVLKSHLDAGHALEEKIDEAELKRFLSEAAVYALSYTIENYRQQKARKLIEASAEPIAVETATAPNTRVAPSDNGIFMQQLLLVLAGIAILLFAADRITASGLDGPMVLMCLMFGLSASFGYYFYRVLQHQQRELQTLKKKLSEDESASQSARTLPSLGVSTLQIQLGRGLELLQSTVMLPMELTLFRTRMAEDLGLQLADIPISLNPALSECTYRLLLRGDTVAQGQVFPPRMMVTDQQLEQAHMPAPPNSISGVDESCGEDVKWVPADWTALHQLPGKPKSPSRLILKHLETVIFAHMDEIVGQTDIMAVLDRVREMSPALVNRLVPHLLNEAGLRRIWVNLLRERVPVKDITFLFEHLIEQAPVSQEPDVLSEQLRRAMARKLCQMHTDVGGVMYVLMLSESWERRLIESFNQPQWSTPFGLTAEQMDSLAETTVSRMLYAESTYHCRPVMLCAPAIRMAMFLFLNHYIPGITVLSHNELIPDTQIEVVGTIDSEEM